MDGIWDSQDYLHKNNPQSPCISTQWTYRDGVLVDLPIILMVKGDVILLRPGHTVPVQCQELKVNQRIFFGIRYIFTFISLPLLCSNEPDPAFHTYPTISFLKSHMTEISVIRQFF